MPTFLQTQLNPRQSQIAEAVIALGLPAENLLLLPPIYAFYVVKAVTEEEIDTLETGLKKLDDESLRTQGMVLMKAQLVKMGVTDAETIDQKAMIEQLDIAMRDDPEFYAIFNTYMEARANKADELAISIFGDRVLTANQLIDALDIGRRTAYAALKIATNENESTKPPKRKSRRSPRKGATDVDK